MDWLHLLVLICPTPQFALPVFLLETNRWGRVKSIPLCLLIKEIAIRIIMAITITIIFLANPDDLFLFNIIVELYND